MSLSLGYTVGYLQENLSTRELDLWSRYRYKYGPLHPVRRYDTGPALIASMIINANGGKSKADDFLPYGKEIEEQIELSGDEFASLLLAGNDRKGR